MSTNVPKMLTFIVILTKIKYIFLFVTTNTWYDSAKHYKIPSERTSH